ncbi:MAG: glucose-6-phosphate dehydrogenase [Armatimonadetes bacterium]|nr:glucose-6-phosphate dehydrogenase [Armatimonadota bacterium]
MPGRDWCPTVDTARCENPAAFVLFGATGDLTWRKLIPAIYSLTADDLLPCGLPIVCIGRRAGALGELTEWLREGVARFARKRPVDDALWKQIASRIQYVHGDLEDPATYDAIGEVFQWADQHCGGPIGRLFYLATPPEIFGTVFEQLKARGLVTSEATGERWSRVVVEKPFGRDLPSARELNRLVTGLLSEEQVYRMDHYLGKETVQNLAVLRFANSIFEPLWNERHIDHVQITMAESVGVEGRAGFYDAAGALRDVVQNHVLEMLALVAMEPPVAMDPDALRDEKLKVLRSLRPLSPEEIDLSVVRGQYGPGTVGGEEVFGYRQEPRVPADSRTETFVAMRVHIDNWRWGGVPFYLRAGKRLRRRETEIVVAFKPAPHLVFGGRRQGVRENRLTIRIQPNEGIRLCFAAKQPGPGLQIEPVPMEFYYARAFTHEPPEAYERLILDALTGDRTLFARGDGVEASWRFITPILRHWESCADGPPEYPSGSWGPPEADRLLQWTGHRWQNPDDEADACRCS